MKQEQQFSNFILSVCTNDYCVLGDNLFPTRETPVTFALQVRVKSYRVLLDIAPALRTLKGMEASLGASAWRSVAS